MSEWRISTPIDNFTHPETGSQLDLVSVVHIAQPGYYRELGSYIHARQDQGFTVHNEMITGMPPYNPYAGPIARAKWKIHDAVCDSGAESYAIVGVHSNYSWQDNSLLFRSEQSINHDITAAEFTAKTSLLAHISSYSSSRRLRRKLDKTAAEGSEAVDELVFELIHTEVDKIMNGSRRKSLSDKILLNHRNQVALEGVDAATSGDATARIVMLWGVAHRVGLQTGLLDRGYKHTGRQDFTVATNEARLRSSIRARVAEIKRLEAKLAKH